MGILSDLSEHVEIALKRFKDNKPFDIFSETVDWLSKPLKKVIDDIVDNDQFERLIKCYFEKVGA